MPEPYDSLEGVGGIATLAICFPRLLSVRVSQTGVGVRFSAPTEEWRAALQEGLITYTPCKRDSRTDEQAYWALRLEPEGEPFKRQPIQQPLPPPQLHYHSRKCDTGFF